jgi:2-desacetyl-2-hydroxyethyl bacteriochlorophyllide A dehydrogenase
MRAVRKKDESPVLVEVPDPVPGPGEALIEVRLAGICSTDLEILRGYMAFDGTLGHEFVGIVREAPPGSELEGRRVVGAINCGCGACPLCRAGDPRHCPDRTVLGILGRDGAFADRLLLPPENLVEVPDSMSDETAVFAEPVAAALEIAEQVDVERNETVLVMGDGRLGTLTSLVLRELGAEVLVRGNVPEKLALLRSLGFRVIEPDEEARFRMVVDATGSPSAILEAIERTLPRGRIVLKTTTHEASRVNLSRIVVDEITVIGSRCGPMDRAIDLLSKGSLDPGRLVTGIFPLDRAERAFRTASLPSSLKVLLRP